MENLTLKDILDLGATGLLVVAVIALWQRLNMITDKIVAEVRAEIRASTESREDDKHSLAP